MAYPVKPIANSRVFTVNFPDVGAASSVYIAPGFTGRVRRITSTLQSTIAGADAVITASIGSTAMTNGVLTISLSGTVVGDVDQALPSALNVFQATDYIKLTSDGGPSNSAIATFAIEVEPV